MPAPTPPPVAAASAPSSEPMSSGAGAPPVVRAPEPAPVPAAAPAPAPAAPPAPAAEPERVAPAFEEGLGSPDGDAPPVKPGVDSFVFATSRAKRVTELVDALRREAATGAGPASPKTSWPDDLAQPVPAAKALARGERSVIVVFHDETSRASRLAAADLWPVLLDLDARFDLVLVDLTPGAKRGQSEEEKSLVRKYYLGYVPTTVVLSPERAARLLKPGRVDGSAVKSAVLASK